MQECQQSATNLETALQASTPSTLPGFLGPFHAIPRSLPFSTRTCVPRSTPPFPVLQTRLLATHTLSSRPVPAVRMPRQAGSRLKRSPIYELWQRTVRKGLFSRPMLWHWRSPHMQV